MRTTTNAFIAVFFFSCAVASAAIVSVSSYSASPSASPSYPDAGGVELTNGVTDVIVWGTGINPAPSEQAKLVGWRNTNFSITFNFSETVNVGSFTAWFADSDGNAGVGVPASVTLHTTGNSFTQTFDVINPPGNGTTVPFTFSGFSVTTDQLIMDVTRASEWTMLSEVQFTAVPEASHLGIALGVTALLVAAYRHKRA